MAPWFGRRPLLLGLAITLLLAGCGSWWRFQQRTLQQQQAHARCLQQRAAIAERLEPIRADQRALKTIASEPYVPTPGPPSSHGGDQTAAGERRQAQRRGTASGPKLPLASSAQGAIRQ